MPSLAENLASVKDRIQRATKDANSPTKLVRIIAVSKTRSAEEVRKTYELGLDEFGENYLQEAIDKVTKTADLDICWHFIGPIQSNKTTAIAEHFDWVQTVDRIKIAQRLNDQRPDALGPMQICIQINLDAEASKSGIAPDELMNFAADLQQFPKLRVRGIMCIPAPQNSFQGQLATCEKARKLFFELQQQYPDIDTLSLGMSGDLEAAIAAGSTMVRIGTDIFGPRA